MSQRRHIVRPIPRRLLLKGAGAAIALPFLDIMHVGKAQAQTTASRFLAFFCPCGTEPGRWEPTATSAITEADLTECLVDMTGFEAEQEWPASGPVFSDITWVTNVNHEAICGKTFTTLRWRCARTMPEALHPKFPPKQPRPILGGTHPKRHAVSQHHWQRNT